MLDRHKYVEYGNYNRDELNFIAVMTSEVVMMERGDEDKSYRNGDSFWGRGQDRVIVCGAG